MKSKLLLLLIFVLSFYSCESMGGWENNKLINGVTYQRVKQIPSGKYLCKIRDKAVLDGIAYVKWVHLSNDYTVSAGFLGEDLVIGGINIPKNTWIEYSADRFVCSFPRTVELNGIQIAGSCFGSEGIKNSFYPNGKMRSVYIKRNTIIQNLPCKSGMLSPVVFDEEGRIAECTLFEAALINTRKYEKNEKYNANIR